LSNKQDILKSLANRTGRKGVLTADRYFRSIETCFDGGFCPVKLFNAASQEEWEKALKESEGKLTYSNGGMLVDRDSFSWHSGWDHKHAGGLKAILDGLEWRKELTVKPLVTFDAIVTTTSRDRDRDVLETKGATLDPASPLLWQHNPMQPIGALVGELKDQRTDDMLPARFAIADTELGRDAATLVEMGALRISHGFDPKEFEPMEDDEGWLFKTFEIFEVSLVSVPANTDAVITAFSREKLHSPLVRGWAEKMYQERPVQVQVMLPLDIEVKPVSRIRNYEDFRKDNAPSTDELRQFISKSCTCKKDAHGDEEKIICKAPHDLPGSWEEIEQALWRSLDSYLEDAGLQGEDDWSFIIGTFSNHAIVCVSKEDEENCYRLAWSDSGDGPIWTGEPELVDIEVTVEVVAKAKEQVFGPKEFYSDTEHKLMLLANDESPLRLQHTRKRLEAAIQTKEKVAMNEYLTEVGIS